MFNSIPNLHERLKEKRTDEPEQSQFFDNRLRDARCDQLRQTVDTVDSLQSVIDRSLERQHAIRTIIL